MYSPEAGSGCPMFDLTDPIRRGVSLPLQNTSVIVFSSWGSPALVPVPWASTYSTVVGSIQASVYISCNNCFCTAPDGNVIPVKYISMEIQIYTYKISTRGVTESPINFHY